MATILDLPTELLKQIFEDGATDSVQQQRSRLLNLIRVSHQFYHVGTPLLYKELSSSNFSGSGQWETGLWARTLLEDGSKASLVQSVTLFTDGMEDGSDKDHDDALCDLKESGVQYMQMVITNAFEEVEDKRGLFLKQCCEEHHLEYVLSIVLARLPNLRTLQLKRQANTLWTCIKALSDSWATQADRKRSRRPLEALRTVMFCAPSVSGPNPQDPEGLGVVAGFPSMQTVIAESLGDTESDGVVSQAYQDLKPKSTELKAIILGHCTRLHNEHIYRLVGSSKALEIFYYHIGDYPLPLFGMDGIPAALSQQHVSLRHIAIHCLNEDDLRNMPLEGINFRPFAKLQTLQIAFSAFFGAQEDIDLHRTREHTMTALPSSLEIFTVVQCHSKDQVDATMEAFDALMGRKDKVAPRPHTLRVCVPEYTFTAREPHAEESEALIHAKQLFKARRLDKSRDVRILLAKYNSTYHSGIRIETLEERGDQTLSETRTNAWRRSGIYAYLDARGCEAKHLDCGDKDLPAFM